jgi:hypothetical protein
MSCSINPRASGLGAGVAAAAPAFAAVGPEVEAVAALGPAVRVSFMVVLAA